MRPANYQTEKSAPPVGETLVLFSFGRLSTRRGKRLCERRGLSPGLGFRPQGLGPENEGGDREADTQDDEERGAPVGGAVDPRKGRVGHLKVPFDGRPGGAGRRPIWTLLRYTASERCQDDLYTVQMK